MNRHALLVAAILTLAAAAWPAPQAKLLEGVLMYWDCDRWETGGWRDAAWAQGGSDHIHFDTQIKVHGDASMRIDGEQGRSYEALSLERPARVTTDGQYVIQVWARTRNASGAPQIRALAHGPKPGEKYRPLGWVTLSEGTHYFLPENHEWTSHVIPLRALPGGTTRIFVYLRLEGPGHVWFDEFSLAEAGVDVPLGATVPLADEDYAGIRFTDDQLPDNLLVNGGFENNMKAWRMAPADYSARRVEGVAHSGNASFRFDAKELTGCHLWQRVDIDPRRWYRIALWAKTDGLTGYFYTNLLPFNSHSTPMGWHGANHATEHHYVTGKTDGWQQRVLVTKFPPEAAAVNIYPRVNDTIGTVWIDDIVFRPLPLDYEPGSDRIDQ